MSPYRPDLHSAADERLGALKRIEMLSGLSVDELATIEGQCSWRNFRSGNLIIGQHDNSREVLFLISGLARVNIYSISGKRVSFRDIQPGAVIGELSAIDGRPRSADVEAIEDCELFMMPQSVFAAAISNYPSVSKALLVHLARQVRRLTERVFEFSTLAVRNRVRAELLRLAERQATNGESTVLSPAPTHTDIASRISTHREAVTRELNRLEKLGMIKRHGRELRISNIKLLRALVEDFEA